MDVCHPTAKEGKPMWSTSMPHCCMLPVVNSVSSFLLCRIVSPQVMDLEAKLSEMQMEVVEGGATRKTRLATDWIPRPPERWGIFLTPPILPMTLRSLSLDTS